MPGKRHGNCARSCMASLRSSLDQGYVVEAQFSETYEETSKVKGMIFRFIDYLRTKP
jgi:hypothetical protein